MEFRFTEQSTLQSQFEDLQQQLQQIQEQLGSFDKIGRIASDAIASLTASYQQLLSHNISQDALTEWRQAVANAINAVIVSVPFAGNFDDFDDPDTDNLFDYWKSIAEKDNKDLNFYERNIKELHELLGEAEKDNSDLLGKLSAAEKSNPINEQLQKERDETIALNTRLQQQLSQLHPSPDEQLQLEELQDEIKALKKQLQNALDEKTNCLQSRDQIECEFRMLGGERDKLKYLLDKEWANNGNGNGKVSAIDQESSTGAIALLEPPTQQEPIAIELPLFNTVSDAQEVEEVIDLSSETEESIQVNAEEVIDSPDNNLEVGDIVQTKEGLFGPITYIRSKNAGVGVPRGVHICPVATLKLVSKKPVEQVAQPSTTEVDSQAVHDFFASLESDEQMQSVTWQEVQILCKGNEAVLLEMMLLAKSDRAKALISRLPQLLANHIFETGDRTDLEWIGEKKSQAVLKLLEEMEQKEFGQNGYVVETSGEDVQEVGEAIIQGAVTESIAQPSTDTTDAKPIKDKVANLLDFGRGPKGVQNMMAVTWAQIEEACDNDAKQLQQILAHAKKAARWPLKAKLVERIPMLIVDYVRDGNKTPDWIPDDLAKKVEADLENIPF